MATLESIVPAVSGPRRIRFAVTSSDPAPRPRPRALPRAIESFDLTCELTAILRRRAGALAGTEVVVDVDPPRLEIRTACAAELRRTLSLLLSALAARPALQRLEIAAHARFGNGCPMRLNVSARALLDVSPAAGSERFRDVERRLLERAEELVGMQRGLLVSDDRRRGELRASFEVDVLGARSLSGAARGESAGRTVAIVSADEARSRAWSRGLRSGGLAVVRFASLGALLRGCDPLRPQQPPPDWVVLDDALTSRGEAALAALRRALACAGVANDRIVVASSAFAASPVETAGGGPAVRLPAPVVAADLLDVVAGAAPAATNAEVRVRPAPEPPPGRDCGPDHPSNILGARGTAARPA